MVIDIAKLESTNVLTTKIDNFEHPLSSLFNAILASIIHSPPTETSSRLLISSESQQPFPLTQFWKQWVSSICFISTSNLLYLSISPTRNEQFISGLKPKRVLGWYQLIVNFSARRSLISCSSADCTYGMFQKCRCWRYQRSFSGYLLLLAFTGRTLWSSLIMKCDTFLSPDRGRCLWRFCSPALRRSGGLSNAPAKTNTNVELKTDEHVSL